MGMANMLCPIIVGRSNDLAVLAEALDAACRGAGSVVLITGEAGVGKSRLLREVRGRCTERGGITLIGRAADTATPIPFRPLAEALLAAYRAGVVPDEPDVAPFRAALSRLVPDSASGQADPAEASLLYVAEGFLRVVRGLGRRHGVAVVLFDDLHRADSETLDVLEYLADNVGGEPVLLALSARDVVGSDAVRRLAALVDRRTAAPVRLSG
jgi:predicted ATPase